MILATGSVSIKKEICSAGTGYEAREVDNRFRSCRIDVAVKADNSSMTKSGEESEISLVSCSAGEQSRGVVAYGSPERGELDKWITASKDCCAV